MKKINEVNWTTDIDIDPEGYWDVEAQEFVPDFRKFILKSVVEEIEGMEFPTILIAIVDYDGCMRARREFYSLGVIASAEEAKEWVVHVIEDAFRVAGECNFDAPNVCIKSLPVKGKRFVACAEWYD